MNTHDKGDIATVEGYLRKLVKRVPGALVLCGVYRNAKYHMVAKCFVSLAHASENRGGGYLMIGIVLSCVRDLHSSRYVLSNHSLAILPIQYSLQAEVLPHRPPQSVKDAA